MHTRPSVTLGLALLPAYECPLCHQWIFANQQLPFGVILIARYGMCANCCQLVTYQTEESYEYRAKWLRRVREITKKGWGWEYRPGSGFRRVE